MSEEYKRFSFALFANFDPETVETQMFSDYLDMTMKEHNLFFHSTLDYWDFVIYRPKRVQRMINERLAEAKRRE